MSTVPEGCEPEETEIFSPIRRVRAILGVTAAALDVDISFPRYDHD